MIDKNETFNGTWPFTPNFFSGNGFNQHYVDEGPKDNETLVLLHGEPTWGFIYRKFIKEFSKKYRVVVPDHMGFGKSETPQDKIYTLRTHTENLTTLIEYLGLKNITLVGQDWGGPILGQFSLRNPDKVKRIILLNTATSLSRVEYPKKPTPWFSWIKKHHDQGTLEGILGESGSTVLSVMKIIGFENSAVVDQNWINAYSSQFPDRKSCIGAIEFPLDVILGRIREYMIEGLKTGNLDKLKQKPAMLAFGLKDNAFDREYAISDFKALFPDSPVSTFENAGHFCQEDIPEVLIPLIDQFIKVY